MDNDKTVPLAVALEAARKARRYRNALSELLAAVEEREVLSEGQMADVTGLDRITVRELIDSAWIEGPRPIDGEDLLSVRVRYGKTQEVLEKLFADGAEHSNSEVVRALGISATAASQALRRSSLVVRVRNGWWKRAGVSNG